MNLVDEIIQLIDRGWMLQRNGNFWQVPEPGSPHSLLEISAGRSFAFTLDQDGKERFPFFRADAPAGMRAANDALVVADIGGTPFVVAVEMKPSKKYMAKAMKQIESGRSFIDWIVRLLRVNRNWRGEYRFLGIVSLKPRRQVRKGVTRRSAELPAPGKSAEGYSVFVLENHPRVSLTQLVGKLAEVA